MSERVKPNIDALVAYGARLARNLSVSPPSSEALRSLIEEILFERKNYQCFVEKIISREEIGNLVLAHMQTFICHAAGVEEPREGWVDQELCRDVEIAICGGI